MKIADDQPSGLTALDRPNSYIGRSVPRPNLARLTQGRGQYVSDVTLPRMAHVAFVRSPHAHARIKSIATAEAKKAPGVVAVVTGAELAKVITPWVGVLTHLKGIKSAPQHAIAVERACWQGEAVCAVVARTPRRSRGRLRAGRRRLRGARRRDGRGNRARCQDAGDPSRAWRQSHLRADFERRRPRQRLCRSRCDRGNDFRVRSPHRRHQRGARHRRRLESGRAAPDRVSGHAGAAHDAEPVRQAPRARRAPGARAHQRRRRLVRHQGAHLCRRDGSRCAGETFEAAGQIHRRPLRKLCHRHPCPRPSRQGAHRRQERRRHHRVRDRRSHRHRAVFGLSAHQRHRGQSGRQPGRRAVHLPELSRPCPRRVPEQECHVPIPRRRPSDRHRGDRRPCRACRGEDRHGSGRVAAAQSVCRQQISGDQRRRPEIRGPVAPRVARQDSQDDGLRRACVPSRRACASAASSAASALPPSSR